MARQCPLCAAEEDLNHLLLRCPCVWGFWINLMAARGTTWACPRTAKKDSYVFFGLFGM